MMLAVIDRTAWLRRGVVSFRRRSGRITSGLHLASVAPICPISSLALRQTLSGAGPSSLELRKFLKADSYVCAFTGAFASSGLGSDCFCCALAATAMSTQAANASHCLDDIIFLKIDRRIVRTHVDYGRATHGTQSRVGQRSGTIKRKNALGDVPGWLE
jgi:hypothetical protein